MDFTFPPEVEQFRQEVRDFIHKEVKPHYDSPPVTQSAREYEEWHTALVKGLARKIGQRGWVGLRWPSEYGGDPQATFAHQVAFKEEFGYYENWGISRQSFYMAGPMILQSGTEEQKRRHVIPISRGETWWCQGYSEPNSGSDLASLQTRAVQEGDYFRVNGQKIWTSNAADADWIFFLARTDPDAPKHRGISMLLADMRTPGITTRRITQMHGAMDDFTEVFFDDVLVPKENLLGELNRGWYVAMEQLNGERSQVDFLARMKHRLDDMWDHLRHSDLLKQATPRRRELIRNRFANMYLEWHMARLINYRVLWLQATNQTATAAASMAKAVTGPLVQRVMNELVNMLGMYGQLGAYGVPEPRAPLGNKPVVRYLYSPSRTYAAGAHEIQLNLIAQRGLGLPTG